MLRHGTSSDNDQTQHAALVEATLDGAELRYVGRFDHWEGDFFNARIYVLTGSYSPDGRSLVFATNDGATGAFADVFTLDLATGRRVQVTRTRNLDGWPAWCRG